MYTFYQLFGWLHLNLLHYRLSVMFDCCSETGRGYFSAGTTFAHVCSFHPPLQSHGCLLLSRDTFKQITWGGRGALCQPCCYWAAQLDSIRLTAQHNRVHRPAEGACLFQSVSTSALKRVVCHQRAPERGTLTRGATEAGSGCNRQ